MPEDKPTVCVSFTPRDEAAALRVAAALREAGVNVVLGSEGGAEVVESCDLFLPIISDNTQAQASGRFRQQWQRAAHRAEAMRDAASFLLPVVVDDTANREAKVPDVFRARAWLRFEVWGSSAPLVSRVEAMLDHRAIAQAAAAEAQRAAVEAEAKSWIRRWVRRLPAWVRRLRVVWIVSLVVLPGGMITWRIANGSSEAVVDRREEGVPVPAASFREEVNHGRGGVDPRVASRSAESGGASAAGAAPIQAPLAYSKTGHDLPVAQVLREARRSEENLGGGTSNAWQAQPVIPRLGNGRPLITSATRSLLAKETWAAAVSVDADALPDPTRSPPGTLSVALSSDNPAVETAVARVLAALWQGDPAGALGVLARLDDAWIDCAVFTGPPSLLRGLCEKAHREHAGMTDEDGLTQECWQQALAIVQARRANRPGEVRLALVEAQVRALLAQDAEALEALRTYDDSPEGKASGPQREHLIVWALLGDYSALMDEIVLRFRDGKERWADVRDWLRYDPRFAAWRRGMEAADSTNLN